MPKGKTSIRKKKDKKILKITDQDIKNPKIEFEEMSLLYFDLLSRRHSVPYIYEKAGFCILKYQEIFKKYPHKVNEHIPEVFDSFLKELMFLDKKDVFLIMDEFVKTFLNGNIEEFIRLEGLKLKRMKELKMFFSEGLNKISDFYLTLLLHSKGLESEKRAKMILHTFPLIIKNELELDPVNLRSILIYIVKKSKRIEDFELIWKEVKLMYSDYTRLFGTKEKNMLYFGNNSSINIVDFIDALGVDIVKLKNRGHYINFFNLAKTPFGIKRMENILAKIKTGDYRDKEFIIKEGDLETEFTDSGRPIRTSDYTTLKLKGKNLYRNIKPKSFKVWRRAFLMSKKDPRFSVESILEYNYKASRIKGEHEIKSHVREGEVYVKSKEKGIIIDKFFKQNENSKYLKFYKKNIFRQMTYILIKLWKNGMVHAHPHTGNWVVEMQGGIPKVTLIDFNKAEDIRSLSPINKKKKIETDMWVFTSGILGYYKFESYDLVKFLRRKTIKNWY
jgi:hypothetical protein